MTLEQLRIFVAVAERQHVTQAAQALNLAQSAASAAIAALEARHGAQLFHRVGRRDRALTQAGMLFLPEARAVLARAAAAELALAELGGLERGSSSVHASQTIASYWLPRRLVPSTARYPKVETGLGWSAIPRRWRPACMRARPNSASWKVAVGRSAAVQRPRRARPARAGRRAGPSAGPGDAGCDPGPTSRPAAWVLREARLGHPRRASEPGCSASRASTPAALAVRHRVLPSNEAVLAAVAAGEMLSAVSTLAAAPLIAAGRIATLAIHLPERGFDLLTDRRRRRSRAATAFVEGL